ncbi:hypothetical protein SPRG_18543, partial [Saprolegnia parasitica CBS 223.65]
IQASSPSSTRGRQRPTPPTPSAPASRFFALASRRQTGRQRSSPSGKIHHESKRLLRQRRPPAVAWSAFDRYRSRPWTVQMRHRRWLHRPTHRPPSTHWPSKALARQRRRRCTTATTSTSASVSPPSTP